MTYIIAPIIILILSWLAMSVIYILIYAVTGFFYRKRNSENSQTKLPKIAVFIPAYKEDGVIIDVAEAAHKHQYKGEHEVIVIADSLSSATIEKLKKSAITLIEVSFAKSTKAKALNQAMRILTEKYDMSVVLDADNVMHKNALNELANSYLNGSLAIQGKRVAKNLNTNFAFLDGISEGINNHIYNKGPVAVGLSSRLVGSGMAFDYDLFKRLMSNIDAIGGFDKELELLIIEEGIQIDYNSSAITFDEKVSKSGDFANQRTRWISAQYQFLWKKMPNSFIQLFKGNFDYFYKLWQLALPPRILMPVFILFFLCLGLFLDHALLSITSGILLLLNVVAYSIAIPKTFWNKQMIVAALSLPKALL